MQMFPAAHPNAPPFFSNRRGARGALGLFCPPPRLSGARTRKLYRTVGRGRAGRVWITRAPPLSGWAR